MPKTFITISDVHHGAKAADEMHAEFYNEGGFFSVLDQFIEEPEFIGVAITGDWWDCKLSLNDPKAKLGVSILIDIFNRCQANDKYFVILRGTYSHDLQQLDCMKEFEAMYGKFMLVNTVTEMSFGGLNTLVIPEEYPKDPDEYYAEYYAKKYDLILGHGFFDFNCFDKNDAEKSIPSMPIFEAERICKMAPLTIFGHDHTHKSYTGEVNKKTKKASGVIYYNGSFSRLCHGEESPKGFLFVNYDKDEQEVIFCENEYAPKFVTAVLEVIMKGVKDITFESIVTKIEGYKERRQVADLKIKVTSTFSEMFRNEIELAKNYFSSRDGYRFETARLTVMRRNEDVTEVHGDVVDDVVNVEESKYGFLFENDDMVTKIEKFIGIKHNGEHSMTREEITQCLAPS
jgi:hypothetical protein